jgi:hypothetical protein
MGYCSRPGTGARAGRQGGWKGCCCLCKRSSRQTTLVCVNASRRNERLPLPLHIAAEITDTYSPSLYISLLLAQIDNINQSFLCALWLCSSHEQQMLLRLTKMSSAMSPNAILIWISMRRSTLTRTLVAHVYSQSDYDYSHSGDLSRACWY